LALPFDWQKQLETSWHELLAAGYDGDLLVIFQQGPSFVRDKLRGVYYPNRECIYIYTYERATYSIVNTIAHEFAHVKHVRLIPGGDRWDKEREEAFANEYGSEAAKEWVTETIEPIVESTIVIARTLYTAYQTWRSSRVS
jgi:hypothetical protein